MGVSGLLTILKSIHRHCNIKDLHGKTVAIDAYGWLHRGAIACAIELATGKPTVKFVDFAMHRVFMLIRSGVTPYLVFDGDRLPSKAGTEKGRGERRKAAKAYGLELLRANKLPQAYQELQKAIEITSEMVRMLIDELRRHKVQYIVAPYEADPQMAYLERRGMVDAILSEDSDLLVFGAKCLITKLDQYGDCVMIRRDDFTACRDINLTGWTDKDFRCMAILSGCDYLEGLPKMGLKTAHRYVRKYKTIERIVRGAQWEGKICVPPDYLQDFEQADKTFLYQWVFCPEARKLVHLTKPPSPDVVENLTYIGPPVDAETAVQVAAGDLHPTTKEKIIPRAPRLDQAKTPLNPRPGLDRTKTIDGSDCKSSKPIDEFFKPKRTPLAELSPNVFIPSPSQQQILARQGAEQSWQADAAPVPDRLGSSVSHSTVHRSAPLAPARAAGVPPPRPKRRRLCEELFDVDSTQKSSQTRSMERSRFFASTAPETDVIPRRSKATKASKQAAFEVWSDESLEGAMAELPSEVTEPPKSKSKSKSKSKGKSGTVEDFAIFRDEPAPSSNEPEEEHPQTLKNNSLQRGSDVPEDDPLSFINASSRQELQALQTQSLKDRYKFSATTTDWAFDVSGKPSTSTSQPLPTSTAPEVEELTTRTQAEDVTTAIEESPAKGSEKKQPATDAEGDSFHVPATPTHNNPYPLALVPAQAQPITPLKGSEDLFVPASIDTRVCPTDESASNSNEWHDSGFFEGESSLSSPSVPASPTASKGTGVQGEGVKASVDGREGERDVKGVGGGSVVFDVRRFAFGSGVGIGEG